MFNQNIDQLLPQFPFNADLFQRLSVGERGRFWGLPRYESSTLEPECLNVEKTLFFVAKIADRLTMG